MSEASKRMPTYEKKASAEPRGVVEWVGSGVGFQGFESEEKEEEGRRNMIGIIGSEGFGGWEVGMCRGKGEG